MKREELKAIELGEAYKVFDDDKEFYLKSEADKVIAHNKYRRCLAMAKVCKLKRFDAADYRIPRRKWDFYDKWFKRWLKVAEQFKDEEAK